MKILRPKYLNQIASKQWNGKVKIITGIRRCGKSYILSVLFGKAKRYDVKGKKYFEYPEKYYSEDIGLRNAELNFKQFERSHLIFCKWPIYGYLASYFVFHDIHEKDSLFICCCASLLWDAHRKRWM